MWIIYSLGAAFFAGITSVISKKGLKNIDSDLATLLRTFIILLFSLIVVLIIGSLSKIDEINNKTLLFLILSGVATSLLWLFYFKALQLGDVNKVTPIDKTSIILTLILSSVFLKEKISIIKIIAMIFILIGTYLMVNKSNKSKSNNKWIKYAILTAIFTSLATILGKVGIKNIESNLGIFLRTIIVFILTFIITVIRKKFKGFKEIDKKAYINIFLSGITTGLSWLCYFKALQKGNTSIVFTIEKLSIVVAVIGSVIFLKEKLNKKSIIGLIIIIISTILII